MIKGIFKTHKDDISLDHTKNEEIVNLEFLPKIETAISTFIDTATEEGRVVAEKFV